MYHTCMQFMKSTRLKAISYNMIYVAIFTVTPRIHYALHSEPKPLVFSLCIALSSLALLHYLTGIGTIQYGRVQPQNVKESTHRRKEDEGKHNISINMTTNHIIRSNTSQGGGLATYLTHTIPFQNWRAFLQQVLNDLCVPVITCSMNR